jgi:hypothetical protein
VTSEWWIGKDFVGSVRGIILRYYLDISLRDWGKPPKTSARIAGRRGRETSPEPHGYGVLTTRPRRSVLCGREVWIMLYLTLSCGWGVVIKLFLLHEVNAVDQKQGWALVFLWLSSYLNVHWSCWRCPRCGSLGRPRSQQPTDMPKKPEHCFIFRMPYKADGFWNTLFRSFTSHSFTTSSYIIYFILDFSLFFAVFLSPLQSFRFSVNSLPCTEPEDSNECSEDPPQSTVQLYEFIWSEAFAMTGFNKVLWGNQPPQTYKRNRRFEDHLGPHHQGCDMIPEPAVPHVYI